ncbi:hypothetical protein D9757_014611 [Collybiopsis confluens]|uniref:Uncharacterized protein n=1 Tax=Collybiopsis confluens TaxID=2823264 RepID=A0A8H5CJS2_9AGAR|nr:hypothetical protein D9757_014611 [Collybiopsis confluens]
MGVGGESDTLIFYLNLNLDPGKRTKNGEMVRTGIMIDPVTTRRRRVDREIPSAFTKGTKRRVDQWSGDSQSTSRYNTMSSKRMRMGMGVRSTSPSMSDGGYGMGATESRGLFVRPQQVLYVVDAIDGDDL